jgi:hypothetical protein
MSSDNDEGNLYIQLKGFLAADQRPDLRKAATDAVLQVTDEDEQSKFVKFGTIPLLAKNVSYPDDEVSINALRGLLQLSSCQGSVTATATAAACVEELLEVGGLDRCMEILLTNPTGDKQKWRDRVNLSMSLVVNITRTEQGAVKLVGRSLPEEAVQKSETLPPKPTLELLLARFLNASYLETTNYKAIADNAVELDSNTGDPFQHFAAVLMNATQTEQGRAFLMKLHYSNDKNTSTSVLQRLLPELRSPNPIRRRGIAGTIRNCCQDRDSVWWILHEVKLTKHLLYPLAGPEELDTDEKQGLDPDLWLQGPDKERETDYLTRFLLVQAILILCSSGRKAREQLRLERVYVVLKWADMVEENEDVSDAINECVQFLRRDEDGTAEGSSDRMVTDTYRKPSASGQVIGRNNEDFDSVD